MSSGLAMVTGFVLLGSDAARVFTLAGELIASVSYKPDVAGYTVWSHDLHPSGEFMTLLCSDGKVRQWDMKSETLSELVSLPVPTTDQLSSAAWSPDGEVLIISCSAIYPDNNKTLYLYTRSNELLKQQLTADTEYQSPAWSPDSRFFVIGTGEVYDRQQERLSKFVPEQRFHAFWKKDNEIIAVNDIWHANSYVGRPDRICRYTPTGRQLDAPRFVQPLNLIAHTCRADGRFSSIYRSPSNLHGSDEKYPMLFNWTARTISIVM